MSEIKKKQFQKRKRTGGGRPPKYNFQKLEPGLCLEITINPEEDANVQINKVRSALFVFKRHNKKFDWETTVRREDDVICVYRIK